MFTSNCAFLQAAKEDATEFAERTVGTVTIPGAVFNPACAFTWSV